MKKENCHSCIYFSKKPGLRNYFIYICSYWGLKSVNKLPQVVIYESIGKKCPFFRQNTNSDTKRTEEKNGKDEKLNIII